MVLTGIPAVRFGTVVITQSSLLIGVAVLPTVLAGAYIVRRQIEPHLQRNRPYEWLHEYFPWR